MTLDHPSTAPPQRRPDGNDVDATYLHDAVTALAAIMTLSAAVASRSDRRDVRALAADALSVQTDQLATISACLLDRGVRLSQVPRTAPASTPPVPHGSDLDRSFVAQLTAHAHASITSARIEMVAGSSHAVRPIAENAIQDHYRQLAALAAHAPMARSTG